MERSQVTRELLEAAQFCDRSGLESALSRGADALARGNADRTALSLLMKHTHWHPKAVESCARAILAKAGSAAARMADGDGRTPLMLAAACGAPALVTLLLPLSDPLAVDHSGRSALMHGIRNGGEAMLLELLGVSDPDARDEDGQTALMMLSGGRNIAAMAAILAPASDLNIQDNSGRVAARHFLEAGGLEVALTLLPGTNLLARCPDGLSVGESLEQACRALAKSVGGYELFDAFGVLLDSQMQAQLLGADTQKVSAPAPRRRL